MALEYTHEPDIYTREERQETGRGLGWMSLLLLPLFFLGGWLLNDFFDTNPSDTLNTGTEFGVGGAPGTNSLNDSGPTGSFGMTGVDTSVFDTVAPSGPTGMTGPDFNQ